MPGSDGRRSHVTILFSDLCGYTALTEAADPEQVAHILARVRDEVESVVARYSGIVNEWRGDGAMCAFGLAAAEEAHARLAIEAALEMHEAVRALEFGTE